MPDVRPFRALRYAPTVDLEAVVAPPYDVISPEERDRYRARSEHNVVNLTLPDSEERAGRDFRAWQEDGVLVQDEEPAHWWLAQDYVGPDGVRRTREGFAASVSAEPYEAKAILPHERTHARAREGRLRLLREVGAQLEPIFLLYDAPPPESPQGPPDLEVAEGGVTSRLWRIADPTRIEAMTAPLADAQLLIADGHHRYETAVAYRGEQPSATHTFAVLVSAQDPGLEIFPTHRLFARAPETDLPREPRGDALAALREIEGLSYDRSAAVFVENGDAGIVRGGERELDVQLVDRLGLEGISYTPSAEAAVEAARSGDAQLVALVRPTRIQDVFERARRGEVMPQKTTYFYPKLTSGLLFHPL